LTICESMMQTGRLRGPDLMLPQQFPQPANQLGRQAAPVPPLEERDSAADRAQATGHWLLVLARK